MHVCTSEPNFPPPVEKYFDVYSLNPEYWGFCANEAVFQEADIKIPSNNILGYYYEHDLLIDYFTYYAHYENLGIVKFKDSKFLVSMKAGEMSFYEKYGDWEKVQAI